MFIRHLEFAKLGSIEDKLQKEQGNAGEGKDREATDPLGRVLGESERGKFDKYFLRRFHVEPV